MAFTDDKYYFSFADVQGRTHTVKLFQDGYSGSSTELTTSVPPLTYYCGSRDDDEFRVVNETRLEMRLEVSDSTLFTDVFADNDQTWVVDWLIGANLAWRGYLLTDDVVQPLHPPGTLTLQAICGISYLSDIEWTPSTSGRQKFIIAIQDALNDLAAGGVTLDSLDHKIGAAANWHAYDGGTAVSGNSFDTYEIDDEAFKDERSGDHYSSRFVVEQLVGRMGAKIANADGRWRIYQRGLLDAASYSMDKFTSAGVDETTDETISEVEADNSGANPILPGAQKKGVPGFSEVPLVYAHGVQGGSLYSNLDFKIWPAADAAPTGWTAGTGTTLTRNTGGALAGGTGIEFPPSGGGTGTGGGGRGEDDKLL